MRWIRVRLESSEEFYVRRKVWLRRIEAAVLIAGVLLAVALGLLLVKVL